VDDSKGQEGRKEGRKEERKEERKKMKKRCGGEVEKGKEKQEWK
jgi:hypothetical protein